jgi:hypothetical protein
MEPVVNIASKEGPGDLPFLKGLGWRLTVNWSTVQSKVVAMSFDVLVLTHTCEAGGAIYHTDTPNARGRNEIIAACPPNIYATAPAKANTYRNRNGMTYTRTLAQILTNKAPSNREFRAAELHLDMSKHMLDRMYSEGGLGYLQRLPQYFAIPGRLGQPGISLRVLPQLANRTRVDRHDLRVPNQQASDDEIIEDNNPIEEEELDSAEGPHQAHPARVSRLSIDVDQASNLDREDQHDGEPAVTPAPTIQIHAPIQDKSTPHEARNFETGSWENDSLREELLTHAIQPNEAQETAQTPSDEELERMVEAHNREIQRHFDETDTLKALVQSQACSRGISTTSVGRGMRDRWYHGSD